MKNDEVRAWITGLGRTGTTAVIKAMSQANFRVVSYESGNMGRMGHVMEHASVGTLNYKLLGLMYYGDYSLWLTKELPGNWKYYLFENPDLRFWDSNGSVAAAINKIAKEMPPVVKDPRWSVTLPYWIKYVDDEYLPNVIIHTEREHSQSILSWMFHRKQIPQEEMEGYYHAYMKSNLMRTEILEHCYGLLEKRGTEIRRLKFPDFIIDKTLLSNAIMGLGVPDADIVKAMYEIPTVDRVHKYKLEVVDGKKCVTQNDMNVDEEYDPNEIDFNSIGCSVYVVSPANVFSNTVRPIPGR